MQALETSKLSPALLEIRTTAIQDFDELWYSVLDHADREMSEEQCASGTFDFWVNLAGQWYEFANVEQTGSYEIFEVTP